MRQAIIIALSLVLSTCSRPPSSLDEVLASGVLRVITRNSPTTYYEGALGFDGPEYQLVQGFADFLTERYGRPVRAEFSTVSRFPDLLPSVERGQVHLAAAGLTVTRDRARRVSFGPVYQTVQQQLIYRLNTGRPDSLADLADKQIEVVAGTSYVATLRDIHQIAPELRWRENPDTEISELLLAVQNQSIDYTIADSNDYAVHRFYMPDLRVAINLKDNDDLAWAFGRRRGDSLREEAEDYFDALIETGMLDQILDRYYGHTSRFDYVGTRAFLRDYRSRFNEYRDLFVKAGEDTGVDWRLLAAIGYQESHWDPSAVSPTGVRGLMMLTRVTAGTVGVNDRENPQEAIDGGSQYYASLHQRLSDIPEPDRTWFALAAYNVGYGHLQDARTLTAQRGGDPNRWLDVKESLPLLALRSYYSQLPHGYARGWEPVKYVDNVRTYYDILNWLTQSESTPNARPRDTRTASLNTVADWF